MFTGYIALTLIQRHCFTRATYEEGNSVFKISILPTYEIKIPRIFIPQHFCNTKFTRSMVK